MSSKRGRTVGGRLFLVALAAVAASALFAGPAQASTQTTSCNATGILQPILKPPSCTTAPVTITSADADSAFDFTATGTGRAVVGNAALKIDGISSLGTVPGLATCGPTAGSCTATFHSSGVGGLPAQSVQIRCSWNTVMLSLVSIVGCTETLVLTPAG